MVKRSLLILALAACGKFEDPNIVIDLRPIAITADPPEQVVDVDAMSQPQDILAQLDDTQIKVMLSDLNFHRRIRWSAEVCSLDDDERCDHDKPFEMLGSGVWDDPDESNPPNLTIPADDNLLAILVDELETDSLHGLGGITYGISLTIGGEDADPAQDQYLMKQMMVSPRIPVTRMANENPDLDGFSSELDGGDDFLLPSGPCRAVTDPLIVMAGQKLRMQPIENALTREMYSVPTLDGSVRTFTESVTYQWLATAGKFSSGNTGGGHDPFGNLAPTHTDWTAPSHDQLDGPTDIWLWIIQRDERLGAKVHEACVLVVP